jgi:hypothetical protein
MVKTDVLWGGTLISLTLDPVDWTLRAEVDVTSDGNVRRYVLVLEEVADLNVVRQVPLPWSYAELTEVHISKTGDIFRVELVLWADDTGLTARCSRVLVMATE